MINRLWLHKWLGASCSDMHICHFWATYKSSTFTHMLVCTLPSVFPSSDYTVSLSLSGPISCNLFPTHSPFCHVCSSDVGTKSHPQNPPYYQKICLNWIKSGMKSYFLYLQIIVASGKTVVCKPPKNSKRLIQPWKRWKTTATKQ